MLVTGASGTELRDEKEMNRPKGLEREREREREKEKEGNIKIFIFPQQDLS